MEIEEIQGAVARGWGYPKNAKKVMDVDLANAISLEIHILFNSKNKVCGDCYFWDKRPDDEHIEGTPYLGFCRRYAPTSPKLWPLTATLERCGEHQKRKEH